METTLIAIRMVYLLKEFRFSPKSRSMASAFQALLDNEFFGLRPVSIK